MAELQAELLDVDAVAVLLGMSPRTFRRFREHNPGFPKPVTVGKTAKSRDIKRWRRREVEAFITLLSNGT